MARGPRPPRDLRTTRLQVGGDTYVVVSYPDPSDKLTPAERSVVQHVLEGASAAAIAAVRGTSVRTVHKQLESAYRKLGVTSRAELATLAR
jgi:DNA-binding CsgD family transcriptional regulator|nr:LuxR C-terminal-related transcriptional regulator [Kofleriaceae bacterium]